MMVQLIFKCKGTVYYVPTIIKCKGTEYYTYHTNTANQKNVMIYSHSPDIY